MSNEEQANPTPYPLPEHHTIRTLGADGDWREYKISNKSSSHATKPDHYNDTAITTFDVVQAWGLDFFLGNVVKYVQRHTKKGTPLQDLKKAQTYLAEKIRQLEAETR